MFPIALALAQFAPMIAGFLGGSKASDIAAHVVGIAQAVTGSATPESALSAIQADPTLALQFQTKVVESKVQMDQIASDDTKAQITADAQQVSDVNATMRAEDAASASMTPFQKNWRAFNGYVVGLGSFVAICATCYLFWKGIVQKDSNAINTIPQLAMAITMILAVPGAAVGITAWHAGQAQREQIKSGASDSQG